jgi:hypothetical protein
VAKPLCKKQKKLEKDPDAYAELVRAARFACEQCGRAARKKKYVCRARKIGSAAAGRVALRVA